MATKRIFTREQFEKFLTVQAKKMSKDKALHKRGHDLVADAYEYYWVHQTKWLGEPVINTAQDMFARQEIIFQTKPDYIIELGVAWGGSLLFYSTLMEVYGGKKIIGIDIYMPPDLLKRLGSHGKLSKRFEFIQGSTTEQSTIDKIKKIIGKSKRLLIIMDSNHTHDHVLKELQLYSPLVGKGYYMICDDTFVENLKPTSMVNTNRPWGPGNNPETALKQFLKENKRFKIDEAQRRKVLVSSNPNGYLKCVK